MGYPFCVNEHVLIPRQDTECLVELAVEDIRNRKTQNRCESNNTADQKNEQKVKVLDLCTGSGCIGITLALEIPGAQVTATDASEAALEIARGNAAELAAKVEFREGFWWDALVPNSQFDLIVSNPPYIRPDDEHLRNLEYEPLQALTDGINGLECLQAIADGAIAHLTPGGWLLLEHGYDQGAEVRAMLEQAGFAAVRTKKDYGGNDRVTMGRRAK